MRCSKALAAADVPAFLLGLRADTRPAIILVPKQVPHTLNVGHDIRALTFSRLHTEFD
jgi:hypothetical protein